MLLHSARAIPVSLRSKLSATDLVERDPCDDFVALGSYWARHDDTDLQSEIVKYFKQTDRDPLSKPCMLAITHAYAEMIADLAIKWQPRTVIRVLASNETCPDPDKPHSLLTRLLSERLKAVDLTHIFIRIESRKPMRMLDRLSGPDQLRQRISYVLQDLFITPIKIEGAVLVVDDICNLSATARVYAGAIKQFCGADRVYSVNMAAARFAGGKDRWGYLSLDIDRFLQAARSHLSTNDTDDALNDAWIQRNSSEYHLKPDCDRLSGKGHRSLVFMARAERVPCPICCGTNPSQAVRSWFMRRSNPKP